MGDMAEKTSITMMSKFYGKIPNTITDVENWEYNCSIAFSIKYRDYNTGFIKHNVILVGGNIIRESNFIEEINLCFENTNIPISSSYNDGYVRFDSTLAGFEFWINHFMFIPNIDINDIYEMMDDVNYNWIVYITEETYIKKYIACEKSSDVCDIFCYLNDKISIDNGRCYIFEDIKQYISNKKYRNGAMKGIVVKATFPIFNADDIYDYQESLQFAHLVDRIEDFIPIPNELYDGNDVYVRRLVDVVDTYNPLYDNYHSSCACDCTGCDTNITTKDDLIVDIMCKDNHIGLEGYCNYLTEKNLWNTMGQLYVRTSIPDDPNEPYCKNYIPSTIIYNPNPFPVIINYLTFA